MWIRLQPLDTVFFRDGKPFSQGEESWGDSVFPPPPSVFYGALRSLYFSRHPDEFAKLKQADPSAGLRITGIYLEKQSEDIGFLPTPRDMVVYKGSKKETTKFLNCIKNVSSSAGTPCLLAPPPDGGNKAEEPDELLRLEYYQDYLRGELPKSFLPFPRLAEAKVGIGRDDSTRAAGEDGRLYRVDMTRLASRVERLNSPQQWGFLLEFDGLELAEGNGILKLGGEHKAVRYEIFTDSPVSALPPPQAGEYLKLCLATPAIFRNGWHPELGKGVKLLAAAIGKPVYIGGFDMQTSLPKPMYRAVPAGSVYYLQCHDAPALIEKLHGKAMCEIYPKQGFGIAYIGSMPTPSCRED
jgi:CRISPR-associated protein Cmr3